MIVVFDTSSLLGAALKSDGVPERALLRALGPDCTLFLSQSIEAEYCEVLFRPKFDRYASVSRRSSVLNLVLSGSRRAEPNIVVTDCADPKDNMVLELAATVRADIIVSSDTRHLLAMDGWRGIRILSPAGFLAVSL